jgi:hypothetical protein
MVRSLVNCLDEDIRQTGHIHPSYPSMSTAGITDCAIQADNQAVLRIHIIFLDLFLSVFGSRSRSYSNEHDNIDWKGTFKQPMPAIWLLVDLLTRKFKLRCLKSSVLDTLSL